MRRILGFLTLGLLLAACSGRGETDGIANADIEGHWILEAGTVGGEPILLIDGWPIDMILAEDGIVSGTAACNGYRGSYEIKRAHLVFGDDTVIQAMGCEPAAMHVSEAQFMRALWAPLEVEVTSVSDSELHLTGPDVVLVFVAADKAG